MKILGLDTSTDACSAALWLDGTILQRYELAPQRHTQLLLPMIRALCLEAGLELHAVDAIALGIGPGAFTGLRVATAIAQGLAYAGDLPVVEISTLAALAFGGWRLTGRTNWLPCLDARRSELYWAHYTVTAGTDNVLATLPDRLSAPGDLLLPSGEDWFAVGNGWPAYAPQLRATWPRRDPVALLVPEAQDIAALGAASLRLGHAKRAADVMPVYLRAAL